MKAFFILTRFVVGFMIIVGTSGLGFSQTFFGFKAGVNANNISFADEDYKKFYDTKYTLGYTAGAVLLIENKEKYGLYTEFLYSVKGKSVDSNNADHYETNIASYQYLDFPVMFRVKFKQPNFNWFVQLGPELSYWLAGKGAFKVYEQDRDIYTTYEYTVNFGEPKTTTDYLNVEEANRFQVGLGVGGGAIWDFKNGNYLSLDLRYTFGHTYVGEYESASIPNIGLVDNLEYTNNVASVSVVYYFDIMEKMRLSKNKYRKN